MQPGVPSLEQIYLILLALLLFLFPMHHRHVNPVKATTEYGMTCRHQHQHQRQKGLLLQVLQPLQQVQLLAMLLKSREELVEQKVQELKQLEVQHLPPKPLGRHLQPCQFRKNS